MVTRSSSKAAAVSSMNLLSCYILLCGTNYQELPSLSCCACGLSATSAVTLSLSCCACGLSATSAVTVAAGVSTRALSAHTGPEGYRQTETGGRKDIAKSCRCVWVDRERESVCWPKCTRDQEDDGVGEGGGKIEEGDTGLSPCEREGEASCFWGPKVDSPSIRRT